MEKLWHLRLLLENLSENTGLPLTTAEDSIYTAKSFVPKSLMVNLGTGQKETVKDAFIRKMRETMEMQETSADPVFKERGPGIGRVITALKTLVKMFPGDADVEHVVDKLLETAKRLYLDAGVPVSFTSYYQLALYVLFSDVESGAMCSCHPFRRLRMFGLKSLQGLKHTPIHPTPLVPDSNCAEKRVIEEMSYQLMLTRTQLLVNHLLVSSTVSLIA
jgi:hypothetical protein